MNLDPGGVLTAIVTLAAAFVGGGLVGAARARRRAFHATHFSEEEAGAYKAARGALIAIRKDAMYNLQDWRLMEEAKPATDDAAARKQRAEACSRGWTYLREVVLLGPIDLSEPAVRVIRDFLEEHRGERRSDLGGEYYEEAAWTERYLRDFTERRRVDLGQMSEIHWRFRRWRRVIADRIRRWPSIWDLRWRIERYARRRLRK